MVSGGAGLIGSHLCDALAERGWQVIAVDNFATSRPENLAQLEGKPGFELVRQDVTLPIEIEGRVDAVFHLASRASPKDFPDFPIQIAKVNTIGTYMLLGLAKAKAARFLLASTSEVYGDPEVHPQPESYRGNVNPVGVRGAYDEAKRCAEAFTMAYHRVHGIDTRIARIFNTHGPRIRADDGRVVPNFIQQALAGEPLTVYGDGSQTRSICYVDDLVAGLLALYDRGDAMPFNIGNPQEVTVRELAEIVIRLTGSKSSIELLPMPEDDPKRRCPDITRARSILGWEPRTGLEDGLRRTIDYFRGLAA